MKASNSKERLKEMMIALELKPADICRRSGLQKSALSNYINGTREPRQDQISLICDPFGINPAWLMGYDVPMYIAEAPTSTPAAPSGYEAQLLESFRQLNSEGQQKAIAYVSDLVDLPKYKKVSDSKAMA